MAITLRSHREIELMRKAGAVVADVLLKLKEIAEPGKTTAWLDRVAVQMAPRSMSKLFTGFLQRIQSLRTVISSALISASDLTVIVQIRQEQLQLARYPRIDAS